jgi:MarR family 2-MHQ and catechol resistance regulon transcriptional repressor
MSKSRLQAELKKRQPFVCPRQEAILNILRTSDQYDIRLGRLFREYELTSSQYNVLRILRGEGKPLPCLEIADRLVHVVPAITGLLDRLEKGGLITRQRCAEDRRVVYVDLTPAAKKLLDRLDQPLHDAHQRLIGHLSHQELKQLSSLLEKARERLD